MSFVVCLCVCTSVCELYANIVIRALSCDYFSFTCAVVAVTRYCPAIRSCALACALTRRTERFCVLCNFFCNINNLCAIYADECINKICVK